MRSLFTKILLWFLAVMALTVGGFLFTTSMSVASTRGREHLFGRLLGFELEEARYAYETGGRRGLAEFLERFRASFDANPVLTDAGGHDLLTGADRRNLVERATHRAPYLLLRPAILARRSTDGRYWFFIQAPRGRPGFALFSPQYLWIVAAVVLLSYLLALHLTSPLRNLQRAVERFGRGDLSARVRSQRADELGQLARTFDRMADRMDALLTAERRLLLDISHELRSPLARLGLAVELARSGEDREAALNRIQKEADRLNELVSELLQVTRVEGDPSSLRKDPVRLDELLSALAEDSAVEASARGCRVHLKSNPPLTVHGDAELLRRAIENVLRNAIRHAPPDTPVELTLENGAAFARIRVRDYGSGVPEQHLAKIFDPFYRVETDRNRGSGGAGLGLAIARRAIELHKGSIQARNSNPGLLVEIEFPLSISGAGPQARSGTPGPAKST